MRKKNIYDILVKKMNAKMRFNKLYEMKKENEIHLVKKNLSCSRKKEEKHKKKV